jgi:asparagine synthase (glutamine-hydrolysing)
MCGIVGKVHADLARPLERKTLQSMCDAIRHRGPDDEGFSFEGGVGLGMRRLQVIDIAGGHQPMENEDGRLRIVFNGEIYNYRELRAQLEERGHTLRTASDTEVILHLYEDEGVECFRHLRGMFAIAIWDRLRGELVLARDRLGKKPLFYAQTDSGLSFSSELQSLLCDGEIERALDPQAIDEYLSYLFVPHPRTVYKGVKKLPPASWAIFAKGQLRTGCYWHVRYEEADPAPGLEKNVDQLDALLREAVALRLVADVPVGAFLSGGLDSSLVTALMREVGHERVRTFSIGFTESSFDELAYARQVAQALDTDHEEFVVDYQVEDLVPQLLRHFGEPFADSSAIPVYHLSRVTRGRVTVALSGDGGDEVFGGYRRYQARLMADQYNRWPRWAGPSVGEWALEQLPEPTGYYGHSWRKKGRRFIEFARAVREAPHTSWAFFLPKRKKMLCIRKNLPISSVPRPVKQVMPSIGKKHRMQGNKPCSGRISAPIYQTIYW